MIRSVGIEILRHQVRLLTLETGGKKPRIAGFVEKAIPAQSEEDWETTAIAALQDAVRSIRAPRGRAALAINSGDAILRELTVPFKEVDQLRAIVPAELESVVHNYSIEDLVIDFIKTRESEKGSRVFACAVPKAVLKERLSLLEKAGLDPVAVDLDVMALFNALAAAGAVETEEPFLILHGSANFSKLILVEDRKPKSIRTIRFSLPKAKPRPSDSISDSGEVKMTDSTIGAPIVLLTDSQFTRFSELDEATRDSLLDILAKEIARFLLANAAESAPSHLLVSGDFEGGDVASLLEASTQIPTKSFSLQEAVDFSPENEGTAMGSRIAVPMGMALKAGGSDALGIDFRKGEFAFKKKFETVKTTALVTIELVIVFLAALALHHYFQARDLQDRELATLYKRQAEIYKKVVGEDPSSPRASFDELLEKKRLLSQQFGKGSDYPLKQTGLEVASDLFRMLQTFRQRFAGAEEGGKTMMVELDTLQIMQNTQEDRESVDLTMDASAANDLWVEKLLGEVRKGALFKNAKVPGVRTDKEGNVTFSLKSSTREDR
ncbi:MAG: pilus assembly protein PilM [Planctomycetota bacterium]|jgi:Tfp pilus assembly PilM family ATPase